MKIKNLLTVLATLFAFGLCAGCGDEDDETETTTCDPACEAGFDCVDGACVEQTVTCDPACDAGFDCVEGACVEQTVTCDPACDAGFECINGACEMLQPTCDPACEAGFECVEGQCVEQTVDCDPACEAGFECVEGACVEQTVECDPACEAGFDCVEGACVEQTVECDPACEAGFDCVEGACVEQTVECDPACEAGFDCVEGACVEQTVECDPACEAGFECVEGACVEIVVGECLAEGDVANLKSCKEGPVDVTLKGVTVTYIFAEGYFLQDASGGMEVYLGDEEWPYVAPAIGDVIDLHATEFANYFFQQEITVSDAPVVTGTADVEAMKNDISAGTLPSEELESTILKGTGFAITVLDGKNLTVSYGTAVDVAMRVSTPELFCEGATFDLLSGTVAQYKEIHQLRSFNAEDFANIDTVGCQPVTDADDSNWGFEEEEETDPPADFEKASADFTAEWTADQAHTGNNGCNLTWTSQDNQDLYQGFYMPVTAGQTVTFSVWGLDNDAGGRFRVGLDFYNENYFGTDTEYSSTYTKDDENWVESTFEFQAPEAAAYVRAFVRLYDVSDSWDGDATVYIDDWMVTVL